MGFVFLNPLAMEASFDRSCNQDSDCVVVSEVNCLYSTCEDCENSKLISVVNKFSKKNKRVNCDSAYVPQRKPDSIVCENNVCKGY